MTGVILHGWAFSPYLRAVRSALLDVDVVPEIRPITPADTAAAGWRTTSPFGKVPAFEHGDVRLGETLAILAYVDAAFAGGRFTPASPADRGRDLMIALAAANYLYPAGVMGVFFAEAYVEANGGTPDGEAIARHAAATEPVLDRLEPLVAPHSSATIGDFILAPMLANLRLARAGRALLAGRPRLAAKLSEMEARPSFAATAEPIPLFGLG
jgi:glutathione S-transferase